MFSRANQLYMFEQGYGGDIRLEPFHVLQFADPRIFHDLQNEWFHFAPCHFICYMIGETRLMLRLGAGANNWLRVVCNGGVHAPTFVGGANTYPYRARYLVVSSMIPTRL